MKCKYCSKNFQTRFKRNAHIGWCIENPNKNQSHIGGFSQYNKDRKQNRMIKICLGCKIEFFPTHSTRKYCSNKCRIFAHWKEKYNDIEQGNKTLPTKYYKKYLIMKYGCECMECGWKKENPYSHNIPIELEHKDGNSNNNSLDNLSLLCPNCHSLTSTYKSLNIGNGRYNRRKRYKTGKSY